MNPAIEFQRVSKQFTLDSRRPRSLQETFVQFMKRTPRRKAEAFWAVRDVSFRVNAGESLALIGANGSGKSTALKLISRIILPTSGSVMTNGRVAALLELGAGFHPDLTGRENVELNGSILGLNRAFIRQQMDRIIGFAELERFIDVPIRNYSSGMLMRLGFSVATAFQPDILLIDEVLAVGDQAFQDRCLRRIKDIQEDGATIVLVSHDLGAAQKLCQRAIWLSNGSVCADDDTEEVASQYLQAVWTAEQTHDLAEQAAEDEISSELPDEAAGEGAPQPTKARSHSDHWGSGEIRITKAEVLDLEGIRKDVFRIGEAFIVRMWYQASRLVERPAFGVSIYDAQGNRINGPNTIWSAAPIPSVKRKGYVDYIVDALPLLPGRYDLTVAVYDEFISHPYDHWHRMTSFAVISDGRERQDGMVYIACRWAHQEESDA
jgi:ABC-type polysaccharide/polyol phosphate transport system ATPase subunit